MDYCCTLQNVSILDEIVEDMVTEVSNMQRRNGVALQELAGHIHMFSLQFVSIQNSQQRANLCFLSKESLLYDSLIH